MKIGYEDWIKGTHFLFNDSFFTLIVRKLKKKTKKTDFGLFS